MACVDSFRERPKKFIGKLGETCTFLEKITKNQQEEVADLLTGKGLDKEEADRFLKLLKKIKS